MTILSDLEEHWLEPPAEKPSPIKCEKCDRDLYAGDIVLKIAYNEIYCEDCVRDMMEYLREEDFEFEEEGYYVEEQ